MNEIKCPKCGEVFTVNESQYSELLAQVRTNEFDKELHERIEKELALAEQKAKNQQQALLVEKEQEITNLQYQINQFDSEKEWIKKDAESHFQKQLAAKEKELDVLKNQIEHFEIEKELTKKEIEQLGQQQLQEKEKELHWRNKKRKISNKLC